MRELLISECPKVENAEPSGELAVSVSLDEGEVVGRKAKIESSEDLIPATDAKDG